MLIFSRSLFGLQREAFPLEEWIESAESEAAIDPEMPIIDPHHHLWDARVDDKGWGVPSIVLRFLYALKPSIMMKVLLKGQDEPVLRFFSSKMPVAVPYMENSFLRDIENIQKQGDHPISKNEKEEKKTGHNIVGTVLLESGWDDPQAQNRAWKAVPEVSMAQRVAERTNNRICTGIVGHIPLSEGAEAVRPALLAMVKNNPNFRGIRDELAYREGEFPLKGTSEQKAYGDGFRSGFALLEEFNLTYDTNVYPENLLALKDLALAFPNTTIILDHLGCPTSDQSNQQYEKGSMKMWKPIIKELADSCPNVNIKLSGLGMPVFGLGFENHPEPPTSNELAEAWKPFIEHCIDCFGVNRCMFASNFPVDKVSTGYTQLYNAFKIIVQDMPVSDKKKLFHDNAARIYKLEV